MTYQQGNAPMTQQEALEIILEAARSWSETLAADDDESSHRTSDEIWSAIEIYTR